MGRFAFHQDFRLRFFGDQQVDSLGGAVELNLFFQQKCGEISLFCKMKIMQPVLPYPLLGRQLKPGAPRRVMNKKLTFVCPDFPVIGFIKIQLWQVHLYERIKFSPQKY